jgi:hypothetical protein
VVSDLTDILQLQAHLMARPEGAYRATGMDSPAVIPAVCIRNHSAKF